MRIPLPQHIRLKHAVVFAVLLMFVQALEHTTFLFSGLCAIYILLATIAFNAAGGFAYPSGAWIFSNATLVAILALTYKLFIGEPAESNLRDPISTIAVYCGGMLVVGFVAAFVRRLAPREGLLANMATGENTRKAAIGAFLLGAVVLVGSMGIRANGSFTSAIAQLNHFNEMAILLATFYEVKSSGGKRATNWIVWTACIWEGVWGVLAFSKQGMLVPPVCWLATAIIAGYNFRRRQIIAIIVFGVLFDAFLVPYSQVGRNTRNEDSTFESNAIAAWDLLNHLSVTRAYYNFAEAESSAKSDRPRFFAEPQGFMDRLNMFAPDDALIAFTDEGNVEGLQPTYGALYNIIPHVFWKDKPYYFAGNEYAREVGFISEDNDTTGISFSPAADAYHQAKWTGVFLLLPMTTFFLFFIENSLSGDIRKAPWGILFLIINAHTAPEGMINGQVYDATYGALSVILIALLSKYVLPLASGVLTNTDRTRVRRTINFRPALQPRQDDQIATNTPAPDTP